MKLNHLLTFIFILINQFCKSQDKINYHFGVSLVSGAHSEMVTFGIIGVRNNKIVYSKALEESIFILQLTGKYPSPANPKHLNLLKTHNISDCVLEVDVLTNRFKKESTDCLPTKKIWKLRFQKNPHKRKPDPGWSQKESRPSHKQCLFLRKNYHIDFCFDYIYGDNFWQLLKDIQQDDWIQKYQSGAVTE